MGDVLLKHYLDRGVSKAELSRRFGVNRRTITIGSIPAIGPGSGGRCARVFAPTAGGVDPYKAMILRRSRSCRRSGFSRGPRCGLPGLLLSRERLRAGTRPREPVESLVRFETPAGRQGQVDFGTFTLPWGRRPCPGDRPRLLPAAVAALLYSAAMPVLMEGLDTTVRRGSGGAAVRPDARRGAVRRPRGRRRPGAERGVSAVRRTGGSCRARATLSGAKGKVERPIRSREFFYGRSFMDNDFNEQAVRWLEGTANVRRHGDRGASCRPLRARRAGGASPLGEPSLSTSRRPACSEPAPRRMKVEQRPLSVYAKALQ